MDEWTKFKRSKKSFWQYLTDEIDREKDKKRSRSPRHKKNKRG